VDGGGQRLRPPGFDEQPLDAVGHQVAEVGGPPAADRDAGSEGLGDRGAERLQAADGGERVGGGVPAGHRGR